MPGDQIYSRNQAEMMVYSTLDKKWPEPQLNEENHYQHQRTFFKSKEAKTIFLQKS